MKCMICGGQTLPGAKLCLPCRAALRRARDDTISELLPLPRRQAFAFSHSPDVGRRALAPAARPVVPRQARTRGRRPLRFTSAQLHAAAVVAFVAAAGVLTFVTAREVQRERAARAVTMEQPVPAAAVQVPAPRVSPSTLLDSARDEGVPLATMPIPAAEIDPPPSAPIAERKPARSARPKPIAKAPSAAEPPPVPPPVEPTAMVAEPAPVPAPVVKAAPPDRGQILIAALGRCGGDFLSRVVCEHRARAQYCDGQWGQHPQCPAGVANDHGQ